MAESVFNIGTLGDWRLTGHVRPDHSVYRKLENIRTGFVDYPIAYPSLAFDRPEAIPPSVRWWVKDLLT